MNNADKWFSIYIRLRDSDENGYIACCTCGKKVFWKESSNAHYVKRRHLSLRYSEINCNASCFVCNSSDDEEIPNYEKYLVSKYGSDIVEKLQIAKHKTHKLSKLDFISIAEFYKSKAIEQSKLKRLNI